MGGLSFGFSLFFGLLLQAAKNIITIAVKYNLNIFNVDEDFLWVKIISLKLFTLVKMIASTGDILNEQKN